MYLLVQKCILSCGLHQNLENHHQVISHCDTSGSLELESTPWVHNFIDLKTRYFNWTILYTFEFTTAWALFFFMTHEKWNLVLVLMYSNNMQFIHIIMWLLIQI